MKNKNTQTIKRNLIIFIIFFFTPIFASAESTCSVTPFITSLYQGDMASMTVSLMPIDINAPFEVTLGSLPNAVESGFLKKDNIETVGNVKKIPLVVQTKKDAQIGSFMVSVVYKTSLKDEFVCQFNLEVKKRTTVNSLELTSVTWDTTDKVYAGILPSSVGTSTPAVQIATSSPRFQFTKRLARHSKGKEVEMLQKVLTKLGFFPENESITGYVGPVTEQAIQAFQKSRGIEVLGIVGPKTREALNEISQ